MNCEEFAQVVFETARTGHADAEEHARSCPECAARLAEARWMDAGLRAVAREDAGVRAPDRVEARLRSAFRAQSALPRRRQSRYARWAWGAALAAGLILAGWLVWPRRAPQPAPLPGYAQAPAEAPAPRVSPPEAPKVAVAAAAKVAPRRAPRRGVAPPASEFIPLSFAPIESAQIVRVRMPRAALPAFGIPANEDRMAGTVLADVVFAEDGTARAIRFVK